MRVLLRVDMTDQAIHRETFALMRQVVRMRIRWGARATIVDATNLKRAHRRPWVLLATRVGAKGEAIWLDTRVDECLRRNAGRARVVPPSVIATHEGAVRITQQAEGFARVRRIRPKDGQHSKRPARGETDRPHARAFLHRMELEVAAWRRPPRPR